MKKTLLLLILLCCELCSYGQIFTLKRVVDKFDDVLSEKTIKTLITHTDSGTIIIEEKGLTPKEYYIIAPDEDNTVGDENNPEQLTGNVYGYQRRWLCCKYSEKTEFISTFMKYRPEGDDSKLNALMDRYIYSIVDRTITWGTTTSKKGHVFWVETPNCSKRDIYYKTYD